MDNRTLKQSGTISMTIKRTAFLLVLSVTLGASWQAQAQLETQCNDFPDVTWWKNLTHQSVINRVNLRHGGNWKSYISKWKDQYSKLQTIHGKGGAVAIPSSGIKLKGEPLNIYIGQVAQRIQITECLHSENQTEDEKAMASSSSSSNTGAESVIPPSPSNTPRKIDLTTIQMNTAFDEGMVAFQAKDYAKAMEHWLPVAIEGHENSMNAMGFMYRNGYGVVASDEKAKEWYERSAVLGNITAQFSLGEIYRKTGTSEQDAKMAVTWLTAAARQGHVHAQNALGLVYFRGKQAPRDLIKAYFWIGLAADKNNKTAVDFLEVLSLSLTQDERDQGQELIDKWKLTHK